MISSNTQRKVLEIYHNEGHVKAWNFWKLLGYNGGIFLSEIPSDEFITGDKLCSSIGLNAGTAQNSDTPWLKFILDGKIIIIPKKSIRHSISWFDINDVGTVYESQNTIVTIDGDDYLVTLLRGGNQDPVPDENGYDLSWTHTSEWNRLIYPIHSGVHTDSITPDDPSISYNQWASCSDEDLLVHFDYGDGSRSWCQENPSGNEDDMLFCGYNGVTYANMGVATNSSSNGGYRPALRLVQ